MMSTIESAINGKCKAENKAQVCVKRCTEAAGISALRVVQCSELNFAHNKRFLQVAPWLEICQLEWEEAHKALTRGRQST